MLIDAAGGIMVGFRESKKRKKTFNWNKTLISQKNEKGDGDGLKKVQLLHKYKLKIFDGLLPPFNLN